MEKLIETIIWPITFLTAFVTGIIIFRKPLNSFFERALRLKFANVTLETEQLAEDVSERVLKKLRYGAYLDASEAFDKANAFIRDYLNGALEKEILLDIKITAVSMHYSWPIFVSNISTWLCEHHNCRVNLSILLVDASYLRELLIAPVPINWAEESEKRVEDLEQIVEDMSASEKERLNCAIRVFRGLPQYHGVVINSDVLFLGRTDWKFVDGKQPQLKVGQNRYRYFNRGTTEGEDRGSERVNLFLNWHRFHYDYSSKPVIEFQRGIKLPTWAPTGA